MRVTSQMLAANQLKAGIEPSSKTLLDYIQNKDDDSLTSLLSKKTDTSTSSLTKKLQKDAYEDIKDDADSVTENAAKFTDENLQRDLESSVLMCLHLQRLTLIMLLTHILHQVLHPTRLMIYIHL